MNVDRLTTQLKRAAKYREARDERFELIEIKANLIDMLIAVQAMIDKHDQSKSA